MIRWKAVVFFTSIIGVFHFLLFCQLNSTKFYCLRWNCQREGSLKYWARYVSYFLKIIVNEDKFLLGLMIIDESSLELLYLIIVLLLLKLLVSRNLDRLTMVCCYFFPSFPLCAKVLNALSTISQNHFQQLNDGCLHELSCLLTITHFVKSDFLYLNPWRLSFLKAYWTV